MVPIVTVSTGNNSVAITAGNETMCKFVAPSAGTYTFTTTGSKDTVGTLYNSSKSELTDDDDSGDGSNFKIEYTLSSGQTVYIGVKYYSDSVSGTEILMISYQEPEPEPIGAPEYIQLDACDFAAENIRVTEETSATVYDQTNYILSAGMTYPIPYRTGKNVIRVTYTISHKDSNGVWQQYGNLRATELFSSATSGHTGSFSMTLPDDMESGTYLLRLYAKNEDTNDGIYYYLAANIKVKGNGFGYSSEEVYARMDDLYDKLGSSKYFTVNRQSCTTTWESGHPASNKESHGNCFNETVLQQNWFKNIFGEISVSSFPTSYAKNFEHTQRAWSCVGFAHFAEYWLYRDPDNLDTKVSTRKIGTYSYDQTNVSTYAHTGDLIVFDDPGVHAAICYSSNSNGMYVLDCNWKTTDPNCGQCRVHRHYIPYSYYTYFTISRANNAEQ